MGKDQRIKAKTIGLTHGLPKRLTFKSGSAFFECKRKRPFLKVKRLVRPLGKRFPAFWPCLPAQPGLVLANPFHYYQTSSQRRHCGLDPQSPVLWDCSQSFLAGF
jgi:hypothetical protein